MHKTGLHIVALYYLYIWFALEPRTTIQPKCSVGNCSSFLWLSEIFVSVCLWMGYVVPLFSSMLNCCIHHAMEIVLVVMVFEGFQLLAVLHLHLTEKCVKMTLPPLRSSPSVQCLFKALHIKHWQFVAFYRYPQLEQRWLNNVSNSSDCLTQNKSVHVLNISTFMLSQLNHMSTRNLMFQS